MRRDNKVFLGIVFLILSAFIIASAMGAFDRLDGIFGKIGFWTIVFTPIFGVWLVKSLMRLAWGGILFSLAFLAILYDEMLGIQNLTPWPVLFAAFFGTLGMSIIFGKRGRWNHRRWNHVDVLDSTRIEDRGMGRKFFDHSNKEISEDEQRVRCDVSFSTMTKYICSRALREVVIENAFGSVTVYFDGAILDNGEAYVNVDNAFGFVALYVPKEWRVLTNLNKSFGSFRIFGKYMTQSMNTLHINGDIAFGSVEIHYI